MLLKMILLGMVSCFICIILKRVAKEYVIFVQLFFAVTAGGLIISESAEFLTQITAYFNLTDNLDEVYSLLFKGALICIVTKIACDICVESGNLLISDLIELSGKVMLVVLSAPLIKDIIRIAVSFVK